VARNAQQIDAEIADLGQDLADRLSRVGMKGDALLPCDARARLDRLNRSRFVVRVHDAD
jgi:hypothetical protein